MNQATIGPAPSWAARVFVRAVEVYQRHVSPRKGFRCAHRVAHGGPSCSEYARRVALRHGLGAAPPLLRRRFARCRSAAQAQAMASQQPQQPAPPAEDENKGRPGRRLESGWKSQRDGRCPNACDFLYFSDACDVACCALDPFT